MINEKENEATLDWKMPIQRKYKLNTWYECSDENYWSEDDNIITLVKVPIDDTTLVYLRDNCPYGWSTMAKMGAEFIDIKKGNDRRVYTISRFSFFQIFQIVVLFIKRNPCVGSTREDNTFCGNEISESHPCVTLSLRHLLATHL